MNQKPLNILILTDRLMSCANELKEYIEEKSDINMLGIVTSTYDAELTARNNRVDYLIIAGYLEKDSNYQIISKLEYIQDECLIVMWAMLDGHIRSICQEHSIYMAYNRLFPLDGFIEFLFEHESHLNHHKFLRQKKLQSEQSQHEKHIELNKQHKRPFHSLLMRIISFFK